MSEHTPGPWRRKDRWNATIHAPDGHIIAEVFHDDAEHDEARALSRYEADQSLIEAAPDLLAALESTIPMLRLAGHRANDSGADVDADRYMLTIRAAFAAIEKARGSAVPS